MITYESCFTGKVNTYSCERTMKEYVRGLFTTMLSRSVKISCLQKELAAIVMEDFIHFLQAAVVEDLFSGLYCDQEMLR